MFEHKDYVKKFLRYINSRHCNIQFTCEKESNDKIQIYPFLDKLFITRKSSNIISDKKEIFISLEFLVKMSLQNEKTVHRYI